MTIYFAFSDENGSYEKWRGRRFLRAHPWYLRSTVCIDGNEWKLLWNNFNDLLTNYELPLNQEIKWSYAWSLKSHRRTGKQITEKNKYYFLREYDPDKLESFLVEAIHLLNDLSYCRAIFTVTDNKACPRIDEPRLLRMHLQESMQHLEMDMQCDGSNLCVLFIDPVSSKKDKALREAYSDLYRDGDLVGKYGHIKDSLNLEHSHHSVDIQIADYLAGAMGSLLNGWDLGQKIYRETVNQIIRKKHDGQVSGYGIREVPGNRDLRKNIVDQLQNVYLKRT